jgi:hypothetical protein
MSKDEAGRYEERLSFLRKRGREEREARTSESANAGPADLDEWIDAAGVTRTGSRPEVAAEHEAEREIGAGTEKPGRVAQLRGMLPRLVPFTRHALPFLAKLHPIAGSLAPIADALLGAAGGQSAAQANAMRGFETRVSGAVEGVGRAQAGVERMVREQGMQIAGLEMQLKQLQIAANDAAAEQTAMRLEMLRTQRWLKAVSAGLAVCGVLLVALLVLWLVRHG